MNDLCKYGMLACVASENRIFIHYFNYFFHNLLTLIQALQTHNSSKRHESILHKVVCVYVTLNRIIFPFIYIQIHGKMRIIS